MEGLIHVRPGFGGFNFPYEKADVVFVGAPLDATSSYRSGYRTAPSKIREASTNLETYLMSVGLDVFEKLNVSDLGDLVMTPTDIEASGKRITEIVKKVGGDGKIPILLGGEHTITYFPLKVFRDAFVIHFDAHRDLRDEYADAKLCHATVMRRVLDILAPDQIVQLGVRSCSKEEAEYAEEAKIEAYTSEDLKENLENIAKEVAGKAVDKKVYLSIDLDVLDPAYAPGVATPEPGGISTMELMKLIRLFGDLDLVGCDIVELVPPHDDGTTAFAAARVAYEILGVIAKNK